VDSKLTILAVLAIFLAVALAIWGVRTIHALHFDAASATEHKTNQAQSQEKTADVNSRPTTAKPPDILQAHAQNKKETKSSASEN
jgi:hypothetical protein